MKGKDSTPKAQYSSFKCLRLSVRSLLQPKFRGSFGYHFQRKFRGNFGYHLIIEA